MDNNKFLAVISKIEFRLHDCHVITRDDFNGIINGSYKKLSKDELLLLIDNLFEEHTRLTSLVNDVNDLRSAVSKFDL